MGSLDAQRAALEVSETIARGKKVQIGKILKKVGYADSVSKKPSLVTNTKSYKTALALESRPLIDGIQREINRIKEAISVKDWKKEDVRVLIGSLDILVKNYQLLSGGATERQVFVLPSEVIQRNQIATSNEQDVKAITASINSDDTAQLSHNNDVPEGSFSLPAGNK